MPRLKRAKQPPSHIRHFEYFRDDQILLIDFFRGGKLEYLSVPEEVADGLGNASSKYAYFLSNIRRIYKNRIKR